MDQALRGFSPKQGFDMVDVGWYPTAPSWSSTTVVIPLVLGFVGLTRVLVACEATFATHPLVRASRP